MAEPKPSCKIGWPYAGYKQVWLYDRTNASAQDLGTFYGDVVKAISQIDGYAAMSNAIERISKDHGFVARVYQGPSHSDPGRSTVRVGLFAAGSEPTDWTAST
jgi:hypothetical protein